MSGAERQMQRQRTLADRQDRRRPIPMRVLLLEVAVSRLLRERELWRETLAKHGIVIPEVRETTKSGIVLPR